MALSTMAHAPWTILSSRAAIASGLCRPLAFGMYVRRDGCGRYAPRWTLPWRSSRLRPRSASCHPVHAGGSFAFERIERRPKRVDVGMMEKRGEPLLLPLPCVLPYAVQRLGHALPGLSPVRALLIRVPLGPCPWLHHLRRR